MGGIRELAISSWQLGCDEKGGRVEFRIGSETLTIGELACHWTRKEFVGHWSGAMAGCVSGRRPLRSGRDFVSGQRPSRS